MFIALLISKLETGTSFRPEATIILESRSNSLHRHERRPGGADAHSLIEGCFATSRPSGLVISGPICTVRVLCGTLVSHARGQHLLETTNPTLLTPKYDMSLWRIFGETFYFFCFVLYGSR